MITNNAFKGGEGWKSQSIVKADRVKVFYDILCGSNIAKLKQLCCMWF